MTFNELKELLRTTDGNLSVHARKLEEHEYVVCEKSFEGRIPRTSYSLAPQGKRRAGDLPSAHGSSHPRDSGRLTFAKTAAKAKKPSSPEGFFTLGFKVRRECRRR
jgi:hypothetical protein